VLETKFFGLLKQAFEVKQESLSISVVSSMLIRKTQYRVYVISSLEVIHSHRSSVITRFLTKNFVYTEVMFWCNILHSSKTRLTHQFITNVTRRLQLK